MCWDIRRCLAHNLWECLHRSGPHNLAKQSPHAAISLNTSLAFLEHANTTWFTTWWTIYLHTSQSPRRLCRNLATVLTPKWYTPSDKSSTSCSSNISRCHLAIFGCNCTRWYIFWRKPHLIRWSIRGYSARTLQQRLSPKRFTRSGMKSTSCVREKPVPLGNLQICLHWAPSQPGGHLSSY